MEKKMLLPAFHGQILCHWNTWNTVNVLEPLHAPRLSNSSRKKDKELQKVRKCFLLPLENILFRDLPCAWLSQNPSESVLRLRFCLRELRLHLHESWTLSRFGFGHNEKLLRVGHQNVCFTVQKIGSIYPFAIKAFMWDHLWHCKLSL